ncbi:MAG: metal ABC transporter permease [Clostridia bacterium]|nr:metal ABC transporter permease [Clostridia bacterium]
MSFINAITEIFSYSVLRTPLIVGILVSLCAALLGSVLVLKWFSMIGDGLSHVGYGALCVAAAAGIAPLRIAIPIVIVAAFLLLRISRNSRINGDSAIALISGTAIAVGVLTVKLTGNVNIDVGSYMFGSIVAISKSDVLISIVLSAVVILMYLLMYNGIFSVTFDESFAKATGTKVTFYNTVVAILTAVTIVIGMRLMGAILISSLLIFPSLTSMRFFRSFRGVVMCSAVVSVLSFFIGFVAAYIFDTPTGASVVAINAIMFVLFCIAGRIKPKITKKQCC